MTFGRLSSDEYVARLKQRGFETIGRGGMDALGNDAAVVLARPGESVVVKVGLEPYADPWPLYAAWCLRNPGPFRPRVRSLRWHGDAKGMGRFFVATMDKLHTPLDLYALVSSPDDVSPWQMNKLRKGLPVARPLINALTGWFAMLEREGVPKGQGGFPDAVCAKLTQRLVKRLRKEWLKDMAAFIETLGRTFPGHTPDPQQQNWMFDDAGRLVLVDPFTRCRRQLPETEARLVA